MREQVKSKQRVADHGEVFTAEREVKAMCDLVKQETERIDSRFLEPACGDGNFLAEILRRKLAVVKRDYAPRRGSCHDYELNAVKAVMSLYGVELLYDNVTACRARLFRIFDEEYTAVCKKNASDDVRAVVRYVLEQNILHGDALALVQVDLTGAPTDTPIIFAEWTFPMNDTKVKRRDFRLDVLLKDNPDESSHDTQFNLFEDDAMNPDFWDTDPVTKQPIPKPIREYPLIHYRRIMEHDKRI